MRVIRIKVKYIMILCLIFGVMITGSWVYRSKLYSYMANQSQGEDKRAYYNKLVDEYPKEKKSVIGQIEVLKDIIQGDGESKVWGRYVTVLQDSSAVFSGNSRTITMNTLAHLNANYDKLATYHKDQEYFEEYSLYIALTNWFGTNPEKALSIIDNTGYTNESYKALSQMYRSAMYIELGDMDTASTIIETYESGDYSYYWTGLRKYRSIMMAQPNNVVIHHKDTTRREEPLYNTLNRLYAHIKDIEIRVPEGNQNHQVRGRLLRDGQPMKNVIIYITTREGLGSHLGYVYDAGYVTRTDAEGYYAFDQLPKGTYGLGLFIGINRFNGEDIIFDDNAYYNNITLTGEESYVRDINIYSPLQVKVNQLGNNQFKFQVSHPYLSFDQYYVSLKLMDAGDEATYNMNYTSNTYKEPVFELDIEKERDGYFSLGYMRSNDLIEANSIIDPLYSSGDYVVRVSGNIVGTDRSIDSHGRFSIKDYSTISIQGKEWTEGDYLVKEKKFQSALEYFNKIIEKDPHNLHARKTLAKLHYVEWDTSDEVNNRDLNKALENLLVINQMVNSHDIRLAIAKCYQGIGDYNQAIGYYNPENVYEKHSIGVCYEKSGKVIKAEEIYQSLIGSKVNDRVIDNLMRIYALRNDIAFMEIVADKYHQEFYPIDYQIMLESYRKINTSPMKIFYEYMVEGQIDKATAWLEQQENSDLKSLLLGILAMNTLNYDERRDKIEQLYEKIEDKHIKVVMRNMGYQELQRYMRKK